MDISELVVTYKDLIIAVFFVALTVFIIYKFWESIKLWWLNTSYSFPLIGKMRKLSKDSYYSDDDNMYYSEKQLCGDYYVHYNKIDKDEDFYDTCRNYLDLLGELKRTPLPVFMMLLIVSLVFVEAMGFAYVLSGYTLPGASEDMQQMGAMGIAFLISVILVGFTHATGQQMYHNTIISKVRLWWQHDSGPNQRNLQTDSFNVTLEVGDDSDSPKYIRYLNRIDHNAEVVKSHTLTILTAVFVVIIAIGATYVRGEVLAQEILEKVTEEQVVTSSYVDPFAGEKSTDVPASLSEGQKKAQQALVDEKMSHDKKGGWATFIVLAIIFVFLQIFGVMIGYKWGFVGEESEKAYEYIKGFTTKAEFANYYRQQKDGIFKVADQKLRALQQSMNRYMQENGTNAANMKPLTVTFKQFIEMEEDRASSSSSI